jgi:hypothetical protein
MLEALASGLQVLVPRTGSTKEYIDDIFANGHGNEFITFVDSTVIQDKDGNYKNDIKLHDIVNTLLTNELNFKTSKPDNIYIQMKSYIETQYSWYKVSTLLYDYFLDIHSTFENPLLEKVEQNGDPSSRGIGKSLRVLFSFSKRETIK